ncbi:MAG: bifunctional precorrin-2 dehydrogenase/sirohydrochlorin ferrochelatase [Bacteroidota bacterium]
MNVNHQNPLFPIFVKVHKLRLLIVGAGEVGYEKLFFMLKSSPDARVTLVAPWINPDLVDLIKDKPNVTYIQRKYRASDLENKDMAIAATNIPELNKQVFRDAKSRQVLINVADTPDLCDFYLGSIVTKGDLKVAISTNGNSPTLAKRFRQVLEEILPDSVPDLLKNMRQIRDRMKGDFSTKVEKLNELTASLLPSTENKAN